MVLRWCCDRCVQVLVEFNADVNNLAADGKTALMRAATYGHVGVVAHMLKAKANVMAVNQHDETAMHHACEAGHERVAMLLLTSDASPDCVRKSDYFTPLMYVCVPT